MPRGRGIYDDEPRDKLPAHDPDDADQDSTDEVAPDDTSSQYAQEPPD